jgi:hypothetical protein
MAIYKNLKVLTGTALTLSLCAIAIAPASAQYSPRESQQPTQERMQQKQQEVGRVRSMSDSTVIVELEDGTTQTFEVSPSDMEEWDLSANQYVLIRDNQIAGVANRGTIRSMTGSTAEVELENGDVETIQLSRAEIGSMNLMEGSEVYVVDDEIVATAASTSAEGTTTPGTTDRTTTPDTTTPGTSDRTTYPDTAPGTTTPGTSDRTTYPDRTTSPGTTSTDEVDTQTQETQPEETQPEETQEPVRGMW